MIGSRRYVNNANTFYERKRRDSPGSRCYQCHELGHKVIQCLTMIIWRDQKRNSKYYKDVFITMAWWWKYTYFWDYRFLI